MSQNLHGFMPPLASTTIQYIHSKLQRVKSCMGKRLLLQLQLQEFARIYAPFDLYFDPILLE